MKTRLFTALALTVATPLAAQSAADVRTMQARQLDNQRRTIIAMADSMPMQYWRARATPAQRDFAQQLHHTASATVFILTRVGGMARPTTALPDTTVAFGSKEGMRSYVNAVYDWAQAALRTQTDADRMTMVNLFGTQVPKWQLWDELHAHAQWTLGQVVANFRMNNMPPAGFMFF